MRIKGVIFDLDGTLIDSEDVHLDAWNKLIESYGHTPPHDWHEDTVGRPDVFARDKIHRLLPGIRETGDDICEMKQDVYRQLALEKGLGLAFPGVEERVVRLKNAGVGVAVGTNSIRVNTEATLEAAGLLGHFDILVTYDAVENGKPAPDIYLAAARRLGFAPEECAVLEDSPAGLQASRAAGCVTLALSTSIPDADVLVPRDFLFPDTAAALDWVIGELRIKNEE